MLRLVPALTVLALLGGPAAADGYRWSGFYGGVHAGYGWSDADASLSAGNALSQGIIDQLVAGGGQASLSPDGDGFLGGIQAGFNFQSGTFVWGIEADISLADLDGSAVSTAQVAPNAQSRVSSELEWFGTVRLRGGVLVDPNFLVYVTGGLAYGRVQHAWDLDTLAPALTVASGSDSSWEAGWTLGAGGEIALSSSTTLRGEYLYYDLGDTSYSLTDLGAVAPLATDFRVKSENTGHLARASLNFKF